MCSSKPQCQAKFVEFTTDLTDAEDRCPLAASKEGRKVELEFSFNRRDDDRSGGSRGRDRGGGRERDMTDTHLGKKRNGING